MIKSKKILSILMAIALAINIFALVAVAAPGDPEALDAKVELVAGRYNTTTKVFTPLIIGETIAANDIIAVRIVPTSNYLVGASNYVVMFDKTLFTVMGTNTAAFIVNSDTDHLILNDDTMEWETLPGYKGNYYYDFACTGFAGSTNISDDSWPTSFSAGERYDVYKAIKVGTQANSNSNNGGKPEVLAGDWLFQFRLKAVSDLVVGTNARIWTDARWFRSATNTGVESYIPKCLTGELSSSANNGYNFNFDFDDADIRLPLSTPVPKSTITFNTAGGNAINSSRGDVGSAVIPPQPPTKTGYDFVRWDPELPSVYPANDLTVTAIWQLKKSTITFNSNSGSAVGPVTGDYGTAVTAPSAPLRDGYNFTGWQPVIPATFPEANLTVTAQWTIKQITVTFDSNGGSVVAPKTGNFGATLLPPASPVRSGYEFVAWSPALPATYPANNLTVTAVWVKRTTISFNSQGGSPVESIIGNEGTSVTQPEEPTRTGFIFTGWQPTIPATYPSSDLTVTAQWAKLTIITFNCNSGSPISPLSGSEGSAVISPANPTRTGYKFTGWTPALPAVFPSESITVNANWSVKQTTIYFNSDGGSEIQPITGSYGNSIMQVTDPIKPGYAFLGWQPAIPAIFPDEDMILTAQWEEIKVESIMITKLPDKTVYIVGLENWVDFSGIEMTVQYTDGSSEIWRYNTNGVYFKNCYVNLDYNSILLGANTIIVTYLGKTTAFEIIGIENSVESIEIISSPNKTNYIMNLDGSWSSRWNEDTQSWEDYFQYDTYNNLTGFEMIVFYTDGGSEVYAFDENGSYFNGMEVRFDTEQYSSPWSLGEHDVSVFYMGFTVTYTLEILENPVESIEITKLPDKTNYIVNVDEIDLSGLEMTVYYTDGTSAVWIFNGFDSLVFNDYEIIFDASNQDITEIGTFTIIVIYLGAQTTFDIEIVMFPTTGLELDTEYIVSEDTVVEESGYWIQFFSFTPAENGWYSFYSIGDFDTYSGLLDESGDLLQEDDNSGEGSNFRLGCYLTAGVKYTFASACEVDSSSQHDSYSVFLEKIKDVERIEITKLPDKTEYIMGFSDRLDCAGMEIAVHYTDGTSAIWRNNDDGETFNGCSFDFSYNDFIVGSNTVTVGYMGRSTAFEVAGIENPVASIEVTKLPDKSDYIVGVDNWVNRSGMEMSVHFTDGSSSIWRYNTDGSYFNGYYVSLNYINFVVGANTISVAYMGKTSTFEVSCIENPVESIEISKMPDKTEYIVGVDNWIDYSGAEMVVYYTDGSKATWCYDTDGSDFNSYCFNFYFNNDVVIGTNTVTVNYIGKIASFEIVGIENPVISIEIITLPNKTLYVENADGYLSNRWNSDTQSMELYFRYDTENNRNEFEMKINYTDGSSAIYKYNENHSYSFNGSNISLNADQSTDPWGLGEHEVTVSYMGRTTFFTVEVVANPVESIEITKLPDKTEYIVGADNSVNPTGAEMTVHYLDGTSAGWSYNKNGSGFNGYYFSFNFDELMLGANTATVTYMGKTTSFNITGVETPVASIEITKMPDKTNYIVGEEYWTDFSGTEITVYFTNGDSADWSYNEGGSILNQYGFDFDFNIYELSLGANTVTVTYMGKTTSFIITGIESPVVSITVLSLPTDIDYIVGEIATVDGLNLKITYEDSSFKTVTLDPYSNESGWSADTCLIDGYSCYFRFDRNIQAIVGTNTIIITYLGATTSFDVEAEESLMEHIEMVAEPRFIDGKGMVIKIYNSDGSSYSQTILETDIRSGGGGENERGGEGIVKTVNGSFEFGYRVQYEPNHVITNYLYSYNGIELSGGTLPVTSACWLSVDTYWYASALKADLEYLGVILDQGSGFDDIDVIAHTAILMQFNSSNYEYHYTDNFGGYQIPIEDVLEMIDNIFDVDVSGLCDSALYDNEKGIYTFVNFAFGGGPIDEDLDVTVNEEGCYVIWYTRTYRTVEPIESETVFIVVTTENKIKSISEVNPSSTSTITFDCVGGSDLAPITQNEGSMITVPAEPTKAGYIFGGWSPAIPSVMPVDDITCVAQWFLRGDVGQNGPVTPLDALVALQACSGMVPLTPLQILIADVNGDGKLSPLDVLMILQYASGIITEFPAIPKSA